MADQLKVNVDFNDGVDIVCDECGNDTFREVVKFKRFSKLLTGADQDTLYPITTFECSKCGHINRDFLPKTDKTSQLLK